jgi:hypothetical protein
MGGGLGKSAQVRLTPGSPENRVSTRRHHPSAGAGWARCRFLGFLANGKASPNYRGVPHVTFEENLRSLSRDLRWYFGRNDSIYFLVL